MLFKSFDKRNLLWWKHEMFHGTFMEETGFKDNYGFDFSRLALDVNVSYHSRMCK